MIKAALVKHSSSDEKILEILIPGRHEKIANVRRQIASYARNTAGANAVLLGPIGAGKSTIARVMAVMRYLHYCTDETRNRFMENIKFDGPFRIDKKLLDYYEELNLTGLVSGLAHAQLFGVAEGAYSGAIEKPGIFEQAMTGHSSKDRPTKAADLTNGIVFLDEIGDLDLSLQPLFLSLLTGAEVFRLGGEGKAAYGYEFRGSVISATWKSPYDGMLRHDLLSRLSNYVIEIPGLNERCEEMEEIVDSMTVEICARHAAELERLTIKNPKLVSRARLELEKGRKLNLTRADISAIKSADWTALGDLRGLRQVLERSFSDGMDITTVLQQTRRFNDHTSKERHDATELLLDCIGRVNPGTSLSAAVRAFEGRLRNDLVGRLKADAHLLERVASKLNIDKRALKKQLADLARTRTGMTS